MLRSAAAPQPYRMPIVICRGSRFQVRFFPASVVMHKVSDRTVAVLCIHNKGKITGKSIVDNDYLIDMDVVCEGYDGVVLIQGTAQVQLPSKEDFKGLRY